MKSITQKLKKLKRKFITTPEFNNLTADDFAARLTEASLVTKTDLDNKLINLNKKN